MSGEGNSGAVWVPGAGPLAPWELQWRDVQITLNIVIALHTSLLQDLIPGIHLNELIRESPKDLSPRVFTVVSFYGGENLGKT